MEIVIAAGVGAVAGFILGAVYGRWLARRAAAVAGGVEKRLHRR